MKTDELLSRHFDTINKIILQRQDAVTGLLPASTAVNAHGDYTDAWVRDNVYSILCVWGLALAYQKHDSAHARTYMLTHSVVKLMRGLLSAMMHQADRVERFKSTRNPADALHAKYGTRTGLAVVGDDEWGHLQLDATSLFLLMLAQMTASGLHIIYNDDEVDFVQNLVHYISHAYATPDFGIWERGNKINHGDAEINCSSVGMAKAALEALDGFNLYGNVAGQEGIVHIVSSDFARARFTLHSLLPRESTSKETDAALLSVIGYPAYAIEDIALVERTRNKIVKKLGGKFGCKRFLLDGHQSVLEDTSRLHYEPEELRRFEHIECEWPLFFTYLLLDALMRGDTQAARSWSQKLEPLFVEQDGERLLPELYIVEAEHIDAEKAEPGSQPRRANENLPLVWAQSLYLLGAMINDGILSEDDIDPLGRRRRIGQTRKNTPLVAIIAENDSVKNRLLALGIASESVAQTHPLQMFHATQLSKLFTLLGANEKLGLTGRPLDTSRTFSTARIYRVNGETCIFLPYHFNPRAFYIGHDDRLLVERIISSLKFMADNWDHPGQPLLLFLVRENMLDVNKGRSASKDSGIVSMLNAFQSGQFAGIPVHCGKLRTLLPTTSTVAIGSLKGFKALPLDVESGEHCFERIAQSSDGFVHHDGARLQEIIGMDETALCALVAHFEENPADAVEALVQLYERYGEAFEVVMEHGSETLKSIAQHYYDLATVCHHWGIVRRLADLLHLYDNRLEDVLLDIIIRQKRLAVGRSYYEQATFSQPMESDAIVDTIYRFCGASAAENVLTQEIMLHLGHLIRNESALFDRIITLRTWYFVQLLVGRIGREFSFSMGEAYERLITLPPHEILRRLRGVLSDFAAEQSGMLAQENLHASGVDDLVAAPRVESFEAEDNWMQWRCEAGLIGSRGARFHKDIWHMLQRCKGLVIGDKYNIANRIGSEQTLDTTAGERSFELRIDTLMQNIQVPEYRQLNVEAIESLGWLFKQNPDIRIDDDIVLDVLIGHAVRLAWTATHGEQGYNEQRSQAWDAFYHLAPPKTEEAFIEAFRFLSSKGFDA